MSWKGVELTRGQRVSRLVGAGIAASVAERWIGLSQLAGTDSQFFSQVVVPLMSGLVYAAVAAFFSLPHIERRQYLLNSGGIVVGVTLSIAPVLVNRNPGELEVKWAVLIALLIGGTHAGVSCLLGVLAAARLARMLRRVRRR